jgi:hypothetical protein
MADEAAIPCPFSRYHKISGRGCTKKTEVVMRHAALFGSIAAVFMLAGTSAALAGDIGRDVRDIRRDRADIRRDGAKLREERAERNYDLRHELHAIEHGNLRAAERWDARRRQEQVEINAIKQDLRRDRRDLARDRADVRRDLRDW